MNPLNPLIPLGERAKEASRLLRVSTDEQRADALRRIADALLAHTEEILAANAEDIAAAKENGMQTSAKSAFP